MNENKTLVFIILVLALFLRVYSVFDKPIWYDEAFSILFAETGVKGMLEGTLGNNNSDSAAEEHPLGYYTFLWGWMSVFGNSPGTARFLSIIFGMAALFTAYKLAMLLFNHKTALYSLFFIAISPFQVHYSQEIRMYGLLLFLILFATYSLWKAINTQKIVWWLSFSLLSVSAQYTHNAAFIYLIVLAIFPIILKDKKSVKNTFLSGIFSLLLYFPWLIQIQKQLSKVNNNYWVDTPGLERIFTTLITFTTGFPTFNSFYAIGFITSIFIVIIGLIHTKKLIPDFSLNNKEEKLTILMTFLPPIILFVVSQWIPIYIERILLPSGVFFLIWIAWVISDASLDKNPRRIIIAFIIISAFVGNWFNIQYEGFPYGPFNELTRNIQKDENENSIVVHSNKLTFLPSIVYNRDLKQVFIADYEGDKTDTFGKTTQDLLGVTAYKSIEMAVGNANQVFLIIFNKEIDEYLAQEISPHPSIAWLEKSYELVNIEIWEEVEVFTYQKVQ